MSDGKILGEYSGMYHSAMAGTRLPRILLPVWFQEKLGQKRNLHGMWKTEVKQQ